MNCPVKTKAHMKRQPVVCYVKKTCSITSGMTCVTAPSIWIPVSSIPHCYLYSYVLIYPFNIFPENRPLNMALTSRSGSRLTAPIAKATGVCFEDDLVPIAPTPKGLRGSSHLIKSSPSPFRRCLSPIDT